MSSYPGISQYKSGFGRVSLFQMQGLVLRRLLGSRRLAAATGNLGNSAAADRRRASESARTRPQAGWPGPVCAIRRNLAGCYGLCLSGGSATSHE